MKESCFTAFRGLLILLLVSGIGLVPLSTARADISSNLFAWWKFDEGSGTVANDSSGNNDTGTFHGTPVPSWVPGKIGPFSLSFNSADDTFVSSPNNIAATDESLSFSAWVYPTSYDHTDNGIIGSNNSSNWLEVSGSGFFGYVDRNTHLNQYTGATIPLNTWSMLTVTCAVVNSNVDDTVTMYINGAQVQQSTSSDACDDNVSQAYYVGDVGFANFDGWTGYIDDARVYDGRALAPADVTELFNDSSPPNISSISTSTTSTTATINWTTSQSASSTIKYGTTQSYGSASSSPVMATSDSFLLSGLTTSTQYHFQIISDNVIGAEATSSDLTFTTAAPSGSAPAVTTGSASPSSSSATINGSIINTNGSDATQSGFAYGTDPTLMAVSATTTVGPQTGDVSFQSSVSGLSSVTMYYYRAYATNAFGTGFGAITSFTTSGAPVSQSQSTTTPATISSSSSGGMSTSGRLAFLQEIYKENNRVCPPTLCDTLERQLAATPASPTTPSASPAAETFTRYLKMGISGADVKALQAFLNSRGFIVAQSGPGSPGHETSYFGMATRAALAKFQAANHIAPVMGYFGPITLTAVDSLQSQI